MKPTVGPFELGEVLGQGGMGVVYRAVHREQGTPAALKFDLHPPDPEWDEAFLNEVRLMASLDHPNCVVVYDTARVEAEDLEGLHERVRPGTSWLAMELASGGSVKENPPRTWNEIRHVVGALLEALAHAHSRGVVHRDIKPPNLLLKPIVGSTATDLRRFHVVLSDFGIGHHTAKPTWMDEESVGTPRFMAPEQVEARWRDNGPWTDLYQVGILMWMFATGSHPFKGKRALDFYRAHLFSALPAFEPKIPVPEGLGRWTAALLEKDWDARPDSAALVLADLLDLGEPVEGATGNLGAIEVVPEDDTMATHVTASRGRGDSSIRGSVLAGAGLGLWGLRKLPLIARTRESHALSHTLGLVELHQSPRWMSIEGPAGIGKSRLAEWLMETAHESGRARYWVARHSEDHDPDQDGVRGMLRRELRLAGLSALELQDRLDCFIESEDTTTVIERWCGDEQTALPSQRARAGALTELIQARSADRPLIIVIEDAHFAEATLRFARFVLTQSSAAVLFVATVRDDLIVHRPAERALLEELAGIRESRLVRLDALSEVGQQELVRRLLGLDPELAIEVEHRTAGNPQFAVQLVNDWVERRVLVPGEQGLRVAPGASKDVPDTLAGVWRSRLLQLLPLLSPPQQTALHVAATFGLVVPGGLWEEACVGAGASTRGVVDSLIRRGLASVGSGVSRQAEWTLGHALFRDAVLDHARQEGQQGVLAGHVADVLLAHRRATPQVATLLVDAGRHEEAFEPLRVAANVRLESGDMRSSELLDKLEGLLYAIDAADADPRWALVMMLRSWYCRLTGDAERGEILAYKAVKLADSSGDPSARGWAHREVGLLATRMGDLTQALEDFELASRLLAQVGRKESASHCLVKIADIYVNQGLLDDAEVLYTHVLEDFERRVAWVFSYEPFFGLAKVATERGDFDTAFARLAEARRCVQRAGQRGQRIRIDNFEGDLRRKAGQMAEAAKRYKEVVAAAKALRLTHEEQYGRLNTAILFVTMGDFESALDALTQLQQTHPGSDAVLEGFTTLVSLPVLAAAGATAELEKALDVGKKFSESTGIREPDVAAMCRIAATHAPDIFKPRLKALEAHHTLEPK